MRLSYAIAAVPALAVLSAAIVVAVGTGVSVSKAPALLVGIDVGRARLSLMSLIPVSTPADVALSRLKSQGLNCAVSDPPLANLTWRAIQCATTPSLDGAIISVDVATRNGVVADIGVADLVCASRADVIDPDPEPGGCDLSGKRLLDLQAAQRTAESALVASLLSPGKAASTARP